MNSVDCIQRIQENLPPETLREVLLTENSDGSTPLIQAILDGDDAVLEKVIIAGLELEIPNEDFLDKVGEGGETPFLMATRLGVVRVAEVLYDFYANDLLVSRKNMSVRLSTYTSLTFMFFSARQRWQRCLPHCREIRPR